MPDQPIKSASLAILESAVNRALRLDPASLNKLSALEGTIFRINCTSPAISILLIPEDQHLDLRPDNRNDADVTIEGDARELLQLLIATDKSAALRTQQVKLSGDTQAASRLQEILASLEIDWEAQLASWIGDIAAHQIGVQARSLYRWGQQTMQGLLQNTEEYLHEEARSMPPRLEVEAFYSDLEALSTATDRLSARIEKLNIRLQKTNRTHCTEETQP